MNLADKTIEIALTQVGVREDPPGSNRGPQVDIYLHAAGLDPAAGNFPWCASFVTWAVDEAEKIVGGPAQFRGTAGALALLTRNPKLRTVAPLAPCIAVMDHGGGKGHAFFVLEVHTDGTMRTLEGNTDATGSRTGGQVMMRLSRKVADCCGFLAIG